MSDPVAEAAAQLAAAPGSTELVQGSGVIVNGVELPASAVSGTTITLANAPAADAPLTAGMAPVTGNVLLNAAPVVDAPIAEVGTPAVGESGTGDQVVATSASQPTPMAAEVSSASAELPRESHLMLLEHKLAAMHAKFKTGERIVIDEFEQILAHIRAVI